jgi:hypothetical protein
VISSEKKLILTDMFANACRDKYPAAWELFVNFRELLSTQIIEGKESKIEGVVARWVEIVDIVGSRCHHAMHEDVIRSEPPIISMANLTPS